MSEMYDAAVELRGALENIDSSISRVLKSIDELTDCLRDEGRQRMARELYTRMLTYELSPPDIAGALAMKERIKLAKASWAIAEEMLQFDPSGIDLLAAGKPVDDDDRFELSPDTRPSA